MVHKALLQRGSALPSAALVHHVARAQSAHNLSAVFAELTAAAERYDGVDFVGMGFSAQVSLQVEDFKTLLQSHRPVGGWRQICEVGFNAGHSAAVWLHETNARLIEFDYGSLPYSNGARALIEALYPSRTAFHIGDSARTLADFAEKVHR